MNLDSCNCIHRRLGEIGKAMLACCGVVRSQLLDPDQDRIAKDVFGRAIGRSVFAMLVLEEHASIREPLVVEEGATVDAARFFPDERIPRDDVLRLISDCLRSVDELSIGVLGETSADGWTRQLVGHLRNMSHALRQSQAFVGTVENWREME